MEPQEKYEKMLYGNDKNAERNREASSLSQDRRATNVLSNAIIDEIINMIASPDYKPDIKTLEAIRDGIKWPRGWSVFASGFASRFDDEIIPQIKEKLNRRRTSIYGVENKIKDAWSVISKGLFAITTEREIQKERGERLSKERKEISSRERAIAETVNIIVGEILLHYKKPGDINFTNYIQKVDAETGFASSMPSSTEGDSRGRLKNILYDIKNKVFEEVKKRAAELKKRASGSVKLGLKEVDYEQALEEFSQALDRFLDSLDRNVGVGGF